MLYHRFQYQGKDTEFFKNGEKYEGEIARIDLGHLVACLKFNIKGRIVSVEGEMLCDFKPIGTVEHE